VEKKEAVPKRDESFDSLECSLKKFWSLANTMELPFPGADENGRQELLNDISICIDVVQTVRKMDRRDLAVAIAANINVTIKAPMYADQVFEAVFLAINTVHMAIEERK
jgi:hypothetical protein